MTGLGEGGEVLGEEALITAAIERAAATLQARMQWKQAEACAADLRSTFAALVAEARDTFAAADSEQRRLAGWVLANCPGEPSQDGGVVDAVIRLITSARAAGVEEGRGDMEHLERKWRAEERRECAEELRATNHRPVPSSGRPGVTVCLADGFNWPCVIGEMEARWSGSGRAPADEGDAP